MAQYLIKTHFSKTCGFRQKWVSIFLIILKKVICKLLLFASASIIDKYVEMLKFLLQFNNPIQPWYSALDENCYV